MTAEKGFRIRFWGVNICAMVPILVVSVVMAIFFTAQNSYQKEQSIEAEFRRRVAEFEALYWNYYDKSILLSEKNELRPHRMQGDFIYTKDGIEILKYVNLFDDNIDAIFMEYGDGKIYSDAFYSKLDLFLEIKGYTKGNIERITEILRNNVARISIVEKQNNESSMLLSFPIEYLNDEMYTVNFLVSFEKLVDLFCPDDVWQVFAISCKDGSMVLMRRSEEGYVKKIDPSFIRQFESGKYEVLDDKVVGDNLRIKLYYDKTHIIKDTGYFKIQLFNILLIIAGTVITGFSTWMISKKHIEKLFRLEKIACGEISTKYPEKSIYGKLQEKLLKLNKQLKGYEEEIVFSKMMYREELINMIFSGYIVGEEEVRETLKKIGYNTDAFKNYFVCTIHVNANVSLKKLLCVEDCLVQEHVYEEYCIYNCLCPVESSDDANQMNRVRRASQIHDVIVEKYNEESMIGISGIHTDVTMIGSAAKEATQVLETIMEHRQKKYWECLEGLSGKFTLVLPDYASLKKIEEALENANISDVEKWITFLLKEESVSQCSKENDRYIKYAILRCVIEFFERKNDVKKKEYILKCIQIDVDSVSFQKNILKVLGKYFVPMKTDVLSEMILYIEHNLHRSDLSYEEVAEVGGISKTYISKLFNTKLGMSYIEYVTMLRMEKACVLLRTTNMTMEEIIVQVGYDSASSFRRSFKNKYGMGPNEYRKKWSK